MKESGIQRTILSYLALRPDILAWRINTGAVKVDDSRYVRFGFKGMADILGVMKGGRFLAIEVKGPKGRQTVEQSYFGKEIMEMGGVYILARSLDDVINALNEVVHE